MKAPISLFNTLWACFGVLVGVSASAQERTAVVVGQNQSIVFGPYLLFDATFGQLTTAFTTYDGSMYQTPLFPFNGEVRPVPGQAGQFQADYSVHSSSSGNIEYGSIAMALPAPDANSNGVPDYAEIELPVNLSFPYVSEMHYPVYRSSPATGQLARDAGQTNGLYSLIYQPGVVVYGEWWSGPALQGTARYDRSNDSAQITFQLGTNTWSTTTRIEVFDGGHLAIYPFTASSAGSSNLLASTNLTLLQRSGNLYRGSLQLADGDPTTPWPDWTSFSLELSDTNDLDADGIPDLTDLDHFPPTLLSDDLANRVVLAGDTLRFTLVYGGSPVSVQWRKNGAPLAGETNAWLALAVAGIANAGAYDAVLSNAVGVVTSRTAMVTVRVPTKIAAITVLPNGQASLLIVNRDGSTIAPELAAHYEVWASSNLVDWVHLSGVPSPVSGRLVYVDESSGGLPRRFYQVREP